LFLESVVPITFDLRYGVSLLTQILELVMVSYLVDKGSSGGRIGRSGGISLVRLLNLVQML